MKNTTPNSNTAKIVCRRAHSMSFSPYGPTMASRNVVWYDGGGGGGGDSVASVSVAVGAFSTF